MLSKGDGAAAAPKATPPGAKEPGPIVPEVLTRDLLSTNGLGVGVAHRFGLVGKWESVETDWARVGELLGVGDLGEGEREHAGSVGPHFKPRL